MTSREALEAARQKIDKPQRWTRGTYAVNARGREVAPNDPSACRWCLVGALCAVLDTEEENVTQPGVMELVLAAKDRGRLVGDINDLGGHRKALAFLDEVIAATATPGKRGSA